MQKPYTDKQGQYLAFIHYYSKIHGRAPAEAEMQQYFRVSPPSVHQMVLGLFTSRHQPQRVVVCPEL
jgi:Mn-dependent DtxR family transcriptional regulator